MSQRDPDKVPITAADMERFHRNAKAAIKRRGGTFVIDEIGTGLRAVFMGAVPLIGLLWWGWSALQLLLFYFVGSWIGILCDFAKLLTLEKQIQDWGDAYYEDWHVWVVVDALRVGERHAAPTFLRARYKPWSGVFVDFVCGGISSFLVCLGLIRSPADLDWSELTDSSVLLWLGGIAGYQVLFTVWEIWEHRRRASGTREPRIAVGMRGLGLFLFMFLLVFVTDSFEHTGRGVIWAMVAVNALIVLWGLATMLGPILLIRETRWLETYLKRREADREN